MGGNVNQHLFSGDGGCEVLADRPTTNLPKLTTGREDYPTLSDGDARWYTILMIYWWPLKYFQIIIAWSAKKL